MAEKMQDVYGVFDKSSGALTGLRQSSGPTLSLDMLSEAPSLGARGYVTLGDLRAAAALSVANAIVTDVTRRAPDGTLLRGVRIQSNGVGVACSVDFAMRGQTFPGGRLSLLAYADPGATGVDVNAAYSVADGSGFANWWTSTVGAVRPGWWLIAPADSASASASKWAVGGGAPVWGTTTFNRARFRLNHSVGQQPWVELYEQRFNEDPARSWMSIVIDDGYDSGYTLGAPALERYGMRASFAIIADLIGTPGYLTLAQCAELVERGHELVPHGPTGGAGSLLNYAGAVDRHAAVLADVSAPRDFLQRHGLARRGSERCYVYPQGQDQFAQGDETIRRALRDAGYIGARLAAVGAQTKRGARGSDGWRFPVIGHTWVDAPSEAANITTIVGRVNAAAAGKHDAVLMLHRFVTAAAAQSLEIQVSNLETILQALADNVAAGTQDCVLFSAQVHSTTATRRPL